MKVATVVLKTPNEPVNHEAIQTLWDYSHTAIYMYSPFCKGGRDIDATHEQALQALEVSVPSMIRREYDVVPAVDPAPDLGHLTVNHFWEDPRWQAMKLVPMECEWICFTTSCASAPVDLEAFAARYSDWKSATCYLIGESTYLVHKSWLLRTICPGEDLRKRPLQQTSVADFLKRTESNYCHLR